MKKLLLTLAIAALATVGARAQSIVLSQPTNTLSLQNLSGVMPTGITLAGSGSTYRGNVASSGNTQGGLYTTSTGVVFQPSSTSSSFSLTATYQNSLGATISSLTFSYDAFLEISRASRIPGWTVSTSLDGDVSSLNWLSSDPNATKTVTLTGLSIAPGDTFTFTFSADRGTGSGSSPSIGVNNFVLSATAVPEPGTVALLGLGLGLGLWRLRRSRANA